MSETNESPAVDAPPVEEIEGAAAAAPVAPHPLADLLERADTLVASTPSGDVAAIATATLIRDLLRRVIDGQRGS